MLDESALRELHRHGLSTHEVQMLQDALTGYETGPQEIDVKHYADMLAFAAQGGDPLAVKLVSLSPRSQRIRQAAAAYGALRKRQA
ncbi:MAG: hypothetical protein VR70_16530 [Rhodospirillaceae bacterium BRH_c57]|nr:MAG: hypothetical protein VR70_16530 [Rhodospirillaceae bacterium BRH_c57]